VIGWYVHGHGRGHLQRLQCIAPHLRSPVTALSSLPRPPDWQHAWLPLDDDLPRGDDVDATAGGTLHWAPRHHPGLRARTAAIAAWVAREQPSLVVVDVSVEVAVLVRSMGVPVVVAAMRGDRTDRAHRTAYDLAEALLAPWPGRCRSRGRGSGSTRRGTSVRSPAWTASRCCRRRGSGGWRCSGAAAART
jgi:hypothetical protein